MPHRQPSSRQRCYRVLAPQVPHRLGCGGHLNARRLFTQVKVLLRSRRRIPSFSDHCGNKWMRAHPR
jgi:hypothetical protein